MKRVSETFLSLGSFSNIFYEIFVTKLYILKSFLIKIRPLYDSLMVPSKIFIKMLRHFFVGALYRWYLRLNASFKHFHSVSWRHSGTSYFTKQCSVSLRRCYHDPLARRTNHLQNNGNERDQTGAKFTKGKYDSLDLGIYPRMISSPVSIYLVSLLRLIHATSINLALSFSY